MIPALITLAFVIGSSSGRAERPCPDGAPAHVAVRGAIDRLLAAYDRTDAPGAAVVVLRNGDVVFARGYGVADLGEGTPVDCDTNFRLASITKQFTARAIALLVEDGLLTLDTPIGDVLPGLPDWGGDVRIGHLIVHSSGVPHYEGLVPDTRTAPLSDDDAVRLAAGVPDLLFRPGSRFDYSNTGYAMLARVVEAVSGRSFTRFLDDRIFRPLGMSGTVAHVEGITTVPHRAYGYRPEGEGFAGSDQGVTTAVLGDGGVYSSVLDLAKWDAALHRPGFQPDRFALEPFSAGETDGEIYGWGWVHDTFGGHRRQQHEGWTSGFRNEIHRFPDSGVTVIVLTNRASPSAQPLTEAIAALFLE